MSKDEKAFNAKYQQALVKVGLGIHIITQLTNQGVIEEHNKDYHIKMWADVLAAGVDLTVESVITDATATYNDFPPSFLHSPSINQLINELMPLMAEAGALPRHR